MLEGEGFSEARAQEITGVLVAVFRAINQGSRPLAVESDAEDVEKVIREGWGEEGLRVFEGLRGVIRVNSECSLLSFGGIWANEDDSADVVAAEERGVRVD